MLHECVIVLSVRTLRAPYLPERHRLSVEKIGEGVYDVWVQYGFMEAPDVPAAMEQVRAEGVPVDPEDVTYFLGRETIVVTKTAGMAPWRARLFVLMARNAVRPTSYFGLPPERVVEVGVQVEL